MLLNINKINNNYKCKLIKKSAKDLLFLLINCYHNYIP